MRETFLLSMERREARRTDSCVMLCRRPASEWRSFREHRTELRRELGAAPAIAILAAERPGERGSRLMTPSADNRSDDEMLTTISGEGIAGGVRGEVPLWSNSSSASFTLLISSTSFSATSSGFLFCTSSVGEPEWLTSSGTAAVVCLFLRVARLGWVVAFASEVEMVSSSAMKCNDLTEEPRRLLRFPFENLDRKS